MLSEYLNNVQSAISEKFPDLRQCTLHPGNIDAKELVRIAPHSPAMFISLGAIDNSHNAGDGTINLSLVPMVFVITRDTKELSRFESAVNLVQALTVFINGNRFGYAGTFAAQGVAARNLFTGDVDRKSVSLWVVRWHQKLRCGNSIFDSSGVLPSQLYVGISPEVGSAYKDKYTEVS